jgi:hypothetical protein
MVMMGTKLFDITHDNGTIPQTRTGHFKPLKPCETVAGIETYEHPDMPLKKFVKTIRAPHGMYTQVREGLFKVDK